MTTELPEPKSRKESYLAKAAGMDTTIPEKPESREEQYLEAIAEGGGGGGSDINVVQTTGTSTTDVMSQDATTKMIYPDIANYPTRIVINSGNASANEVLAINGNSASVDGIAISPDSNNTAKIATLGRASDSIASGRKATVAYGDNSISIGYNSSSNSGGNTGYNVAIGSDAKAGNLSHKYTVALGAYASTTRDGEVNIGTGSTTNGYNSTKYRVIGGVHDGQLAQDAVTVAQVNATIDAINTALSTSIPHIGATS